MFKKLLQLKTLLVALLVMTGAGNVWGQTAAYTFKTQKSTANTAYATNYNVTIDGLQWSVPGNQNFTGFVRIGGKSISTNVDREIFSKSPLNKQISKITFNHKGRSNENLDVNSIKLVVATNSTFTNQIDEITLKPEIEVSTDGNFDFEPDKVAVWPSGSYYKFIVNVTNNNPTNYGLDVSTIDFFESSTSLSSISLSGDFPTAFYKGDTFSHEGMTVTATYSDESTKDVTSKATFSGYNMSTTGVQTVTVSYTEGSVTKTANYNITVTARPAFSVTLGDDNTILTEESAGAGVELPTRSSIGDYDFAGWSTMNVTVETSNSPTIIPAGEYSPSSNTTLYPVYTRSEVTGEAVETKTPQTLEYDTWAYSKDKTDDKTSYRLFGNGGYVESAEFDLSTLSKVIVYGGTFGGSSYNQLEIGDGTKVWKSVAVSGSSQTGKNEYTSQGATPLTGTGKLRVTSKSGNASGSGVRMSKIEIFTMETPMTSYYTSHPSGKETPTWTFTPSALETLYVGEADATFTVTTNYDGTLTASSSDDAIAIITKTGDRTFSVHAVAKGDVVFTISGDETENYKAVSKTIAASVLQKYAVTIEAPVNGTLVLKNGDVDVATGDKFLPGTVLTAFVTPAEDYNFRNWQAVDETTHTYTANFSYTMTEHDVTFKANFDAKVYHTVSWSVNGVVVSSDAKTEEGSAIAFGAPAASAIPEGYTFMGWSATQILTPQATAPTYVTEATMGNADVTYYAVLAVDSSTPVVEHTSTFTIKQASAPNSPFESEDVNWTWSNVTFENGTNSCIDKTNGSVFFNLPSGGKAKTLKITRTSNQWASAAEVVLKDASDNSLYTFSLGSESSATYNFTSTDNQSSSYTLSNTTTKNAWTDNIQFVYETGGESFSGYCTTIPPSELTISLNAACHDAGGMVYGTYSSSHPFVVSDDIVVSEISIENDAFHVEAYETGAVVPANTGVMVSAPKGGDYTVNVAATEGASVLDAANCLRPTGDNGITADDMGAADTGCLFYRLTMHNGTQIGYWWGAENGAAFAVAANKAYMAIPEAEAARMMGNGFGEIFTGIVSTEQQRESVATYNLLGQRVSPDTKGVLIRNGKKLINK